MILADEPCASLDAHTAQEVLTEFLAVCREDAKTVLIASHEDPVLAAWQYGLGRSVAWTSDARGQWTAGLLRSDVSGKLFTQIVAWTLPTGNGDPLQTEAKVTGDSLEVSGPYGTGRLLETPVFSLLILDNGRMVAGAVTPKGLESAATQIVSTT